MSNQNGSHKKETSVDTLSKNMAEKVAIVNDDDKEELSPGNFIFKINLFL
jgi:hypothetical protein